MTLLFFLTSFAVAKIALCFVSHRGTSIFIIYYYFFLPMSIFHDFLKENANCTEILAVVKTLPLQSLSPGQHVKFVTKPSPYKASVMDKEMVSIGNKQYPRYWQTQKLSPRVRS